MEQEFVKRTLRDYEEVVDRAKEVGSVVAKLRGIGIATFNPVEFNGDTVHISWDEFSMGCFMGTESLDYPLCYLWLSATTIIAMEEDAKQEREALRERAAQLERQKRQEEKEERDRAEYERLKRKYETEILGERHGE